MSNDRPGIDQTLFILDIDGTLSQLVPDAADAVVASDAISVVEDLVERSAGVCAVTGRTLERARELLPVSGVNFAAVHGAHILWSDGIEDVDEVALASRPHLDRILTLAHTVGWQHEDKGFSVTMSLRESTNPDQTRRQMRSQLQMVVDPRAIEIHDCHHSLEARGIGSRCKGVATRMILERFSGEFSYVFAAGDDYTDVKTFQELSMLDDLNNERVVVSPEIAPEELVALSTSSADNPGILVQSLAEFLS